ncbi:MAG: acyltransferase [Bacteroidetes bacterium]|nr:acyltransferase [Bacteroidota bacterium]
MNKKLDYIDSLRGLAIIGVVAIHASKYGTFVVPEIIQRIVEHGARGVQLFFIASAFTLFYSFDYRIKSEKNPVRNFFIRRFFRIAPMYYMGILYYIWQDGLGARYALGDMDHISAGNIISNFFFLHGLNPYWITSLVPGGWSISVEMMFYLLLPIVYNGIKNINHAFIFFMITLVLRKALALAFVSHPQIAFERLWDEFLFFYFPSQLPIFSLGILMYFVIKDNGFQNISGLNLLLFSFLILIQTATEIYFLLPIHLMFGIGFFILGIALSRYQPKLIVNKIINHIGKVSFSLYLVHFATLHWMEIFGFVDFLSPINLTSNLANYFIRLIVCLAISVGISTLLYNILEIPFQNLGKKLIIIFEKKNAISE